MALSQALRARTGLQLVQELDRDAASRGVPADVIAVCARATRRRFAKRLDERFDDELQRRITAYYHGVIRGCAIRSRGSRLAATRREFVLASIARDLAEAGASLERIEREISEIYPGAVPPAEIERIAVCTMGRLAS